MVELRARKLVMVPLAEILPDERNARMHDKDQIEKLRQSLREYGFVKPVLLDDDKRLIAGHGICEAAGAEGMEAVPAVFASGLTEEQRRAYALADNRLAELSKWDMGKVKLEMQELSALSIDVSSVGFDMEALTGDDIPDFDLDGDELGETESKGTTVVCPHCGFEWVKK